MPSLSSCQPPPLSPTNDDTEWDFGEEGKPQTAAETNALHYLDTGLKAAARSCFRNIKNTEVESVALSTVTTKPGKTEAYERTLRVILETIMEESKRTKLKSVSLFAASGEEANRLIKLAVAMGATLA